MTPVLGITEGGVKRTRRDPRMLPKTVIYDPELTFSLPAAVSGPSGMNAIAHCVEALYAEDANPLTSLIAEEGIRALAASLPVVVREPEHLEARSEALYGAWLGGTALAAVGMALHHKLCHVLGGTFDLPHAEVHTIVLPHATAYNRAGAPAAMARIARRSAPRTRRRACSTSPPRSAPSRASPRSACASQTSIAPPTSPSRAPTPTRPRSPASASAPCSTTPSTAAGRRLDDPVYISPGRLLPPGLRPCRWPLTYSTALHEAIRRNSWSLASICGSRRARLTGQPACIGYPRI